MYYHVILVLQQAHGLMDQEHSNHSTSMAILEDFIKQAMLECISKMTAPQDYNQAIHKGAALEDYCQGINKGAAQGHYSLIVSNSHREATELPRWPNHQHILQVRTPFFFLQECHLLPNCGHLHSTKNT